MKYPPLRFRGAPTSNSDNRTNWITEKGFRDPREHRAGLDKHRLVSKTYREASKGRLENGLTSRVFRNDVIGLMLERWSLGPVVQSFAPLLELGPRTGARVHWLRCRGRPTIRYSS